MSTRTALVAALAVVAAIAIYLMLGKDEASETSPPAPATSAESSGSGPAIATPTPRRSAATPSEPERVSVRGRVEAGGAPLAGAVVTLTPSDKEALDEPRSVRSGADGAFEIAEVLPGRYAAAATATGHLPAVQRNVEVQVEADVSITLTLLPGGHPLRGTISDATGGTLEGALVRLTPLAGVASLRTLDGFGTLSTEDGTYAVHVSPGRYRVDVSHPDYAADSRAVEVGPGAQSQDFALVPMGVIEGVVRHDGGEPVPRAWVSWQRERQQTIVPGHRMSMTAGGGVVRADDEGHFVVRGVRPGAIHLRGRGPTAASTAPTVVPLAMAEHVTDVVVRVQTAYEVQGRVVAKDEPERGLLGVEVKLHIDGPGFRPRDTTDDEGHFVLTGVTAGPHVLGADADGWHLADDVRVQVEDASPDDVLIQMERAPAIRGRVEPAEVAQVAIELRPENIAMGAGRSVLMATDRTESDEDGRFELGMPRPGRTTVVARVADGRAGEVTLDVGSEGVDDVVINLEARATVSGTVRSGATSVAQATVSLHEVKAPGQTDVRLVINGLEVGHDAGVTTEDGRFEIGGVADGEYEVKVTDRYGEPLPVQTGARLTVAGSKDIEGHQLVVDAHDGVISGVVRTTDGEPVPDVWVHANVLHTMTGPPSKDEGPTVRSEMRMVISSDTSGSRQRPPVLTDEDGRFEITGLRDADYELMAEGDGGGQRAYVTARPGQEATLELAPLSTIEGTVTLDGNTVESFTLRLQGPGSTMTHVRDRGGHFEVPRLDPGKYTVSISCAQGRGSAEVTVAAGETATADVTLETLLTVTGVVVDAEGEPVEGARIMLGDGAGGRISVTSHGDEEHNKTDAEGRFEVQCAPGPRVLLAMSPGSMRPMVMHRFTANPGEDVDVGELKEGDMGMMGGSGPPDGSP